MSAEEERALYSAAEQAADLHELTAQVADVLESAGASGVDRRAIPGLRQALATLNPGADTRYDNITCRRGAYGSDAEFIEAVVDAECEIDRRIHAVTGLLEECQRAIDVADDAWQKAHHDLAAARAHMSAAYAMPVSEPCTGCHGARSFEITLAGAEIASAEQQIADVRERAGIAAAAADLLDETAPVLVRALNWLRAVPGDVSEALELVHCFVRAGGKLPRLARQWFTGETLAR